MKGQADEWTDGKREVRGGRCERGVEVWKPMLISNPHHDRRTVDRSPDVRRVRVPG